MSTGGPDGVKALGFAKVDYANAAEVQAAIAIFGSVWTGINVQQAQQAQFSAGQPWDWVPGSPIDGGHSVIVGGYGQAGAGALGGDQRFITWAAETSFTDNFWANGVEEAWVVIWPEHLGSKEFLAGVDLTALAADYTAITGQPFPAAVPPPGTGPCPSAAPVSGTACPRCRPCPDRIPTRLTWPWLTRSRSGHTGAAMPRTGFLLRPCGPGWSRRGSWLAEGEPISPPGFVSEEGLVFSVAGVVPPAVEVLRGWRRGGYCRRAA